MGGGMAGLYSALLLQSLGVKVHIFEASSRLGGRIYTHRFTEQENQYFEAGAMRLPNRPEQQPVFDLINYLNCKQRETKIELMPYNLTCETGNLVYVNRQRLTVKQARGFPWALGFGENTPAEEYLEEAIARFVVPFKESFEKGFANLMEYDDYSFYSYLSMKLGWPAHKIGYVETMMSQSNQFHASLTELVIESMDFLNADWKTIKNGMDHLPRVCAKLIGYGNITMGAKVQQVERQADGRIAIHHTAKSTPDVFDKVIVALPPSALRMIKMPQFDWKKEWAIRAFHFEPLFKIGLRFKSRFWEDEEISLYPAKGGQSITDLPSRWIVYPSYGIGEKQAGVLLLYSWMTDAYGWLPQSRDERIRLALRDLQEVYGDKVDLRSEFMEAFDVAWSNEWPTGDAMFLPGQFKHLFNIARRPEGNIHFAGEHLSVHHTWIVGAIESALNACQQIFNDPGLKPLRPEGALSSSGEGGEHVYDYSKLVEEAKRAYDALRRGESHPQLQQAMQKGSSQERFLLHLKQW
ncbi:flavin monoamine oxidase family protein [Cystobacter fuscus]